MSGKKLFRVGKHLRPPPSEEENDDDDSSDEEEEEDEDDEHPPNKPSTSKKSNANLSSEEDEEEDDEEDDEDEEEEDEEESKKKRRRSSAKGSNKRSKISSFFDEEAEDDDEDEDEDEPYGTHRDPDDVVRKHYTAEDIRKEQMDEETREMIARQDRRRAQAGFSFGEERSVAEMAKEIEDRHRMSRTAVDRRMLDQRHHRPTGRAGGASGASVARDDDDVDEGEGGGPEVTNAVSQQSLVPSVSDPSLWMVSCSTGKEQELIIQIMNKCVAYARQGRPLGICGAIAAQTKGKIYIESYSEPAVVEAINGVRGLLQYTMRLVPIQDMTTVMTVVPKKKPVTKNEWVRMTRGHYKGDLALVVAVRESGLKCIVQCVPRLDLAALGLSKEEQRVRKKTVRPPQKFFNEQELATLGFAAQRTRQRFPGMDMYCDFFENNYYQDGYLLKEVTVGSMVKPCTDEDPPTLDELQKFRKRNKGKDEDGDDENEGSKAAGSLLDELSELQGKAGLSKSSTSASGGLLVGDKVEVVEGDLVGMKGKIMSMDGTTLKIKPMDASLDIGGTGEIEFLANQVRKHIAVGAHVKVMDGRYANETGTVVAVEQLDGGKDFTAVVLTDVTNKEISVRTSQLRESAEQYSGQDKLAGYQLYDLVMLSGGGSANEVGVIVRVGREDFTVINNHGVSRDVRPEELRGKRNTMSNRAVALDVQGNQIRSGDQVNVAEGPHKGKAATIKRLSRSQLFLYSQTRTESAGIFVVRSRSCLLAGSRNQSRGVAGVDGSMSPFATPQSQSRGPAAGVRGKGQDSLIGKTVRIQAGQWKGYLGAVSDATATHVQVELHSRLKKVMVVRERVAVVGDKFGATEEVNQNDPNMHNGPGAAFSAAATPMHGGATPMHGGATPMHDSMSDEVWRPGALDHESTQEELASSAWGADTSQPFGSPNNDDSGWGSSQSGGTWTPTATKQEPSTSVPVKLEQPGTTLETHAGDNDETAVWFMERVCVQLKGDDRPAVIKEINPDKSALVELEDQSTKTVSFDEVSRIQPKEKDMVLVIGGADVGVEGELVCIDGSDAILKDANEDFKIVDFVHLAKIASDG
ncbi:KOW motif-containing protein [Nitzschia inconspicua]|uniref:Transcription elongation factor SPT5 n=1 Tax=Nitzschia inconspicua TaxID=303405 RepID=A0A9K3PKB0_9STRA|nr:KOW motif-containing protein [Nitzschia inconspicua]